MTTQEFIELRLAQANISIHEQEYIKRRNAKYGMDHLEMTPKTHQVDCSNLDSRSGEGKFYAERMAELKKKYKLDRLELQGEAPKKDETSIEDYVNIESKKAQKGYKLKVSQATFNGKKLNIWFEVKL